MKQQRLCIIGIGSPYAEDSLGLRLIQRLARRELPPWVEFRALDRPGLALLERMQGFERVILLDLLPQLASGEIRELALDELECQASPLSDHSLGVAETLALGRVLGDLPRSLRILGLGPVEEVDDPLLDRLLRLCISGREQTSPAAWPVD